MDLNERKRRNETRRRLVLFKMEAYERLLTQELDPDTPEWANAFNKREALEHDMDEVYWEDIRIKDERHREEENRRY